MSFNKRKRQGNVVTSPGQQHFNKKSKPLSDPEEVKNTQGPKEENACDRVERVKVVQTTKEDRESISSSHEVSETIYDITPPKKGLVLILNNSFWNINNKKRTGSEIDVENMKNLWLKMGCDLHGEKTHWDQTASQMLELIKEVNHVDGYSYLVIVIMTHGRSEKDESFFQGSDEKEVKMNKVEDIFRKPGSKVKDIPKLLILQFCRAEQVPRNVSAECCEEFSRAITLFLGRIKDKIKRRSTNPLPNMLVAYATMYGCVAMRHTTCGSWFINAITNIFMKHACREHVMELLKKVRDSMIAKKENEGGTLYEAQADFQGTLTKKFYLFP